MVFIDNVQGNYFRPEAGGLTLVGVPCQEWDIDPDTLGTGLPPGAAELGAGLLTHRIPAMERATLSRGYRAFDGYSADRHAILGAVDGIDGLYLATAFSGSGFKIAPAVGTCMAELITDGRAKTVDIEAFGLGRFARGRTVEGPYPVRGAAGLRGSRRRERRTMESRAAARRRVPHLHGARPLPAHRAARHRHRHPLARGRRARAARARRASARSRSWPSRTRGSATWRCGCSRSATRRPR